MPKFEGNIDKIDRLSSLPDSILTDILGLLPLHSAVATSVLSRPWRHLWTQLTRIDLDSIKIRPKGHWLTTVNNLFARFTSPKVHSFRVLFDSAERVQACSSSVESWIAVVCSRQIEQIEVTSPWYPSVMLPNSVFTCQSLVVLNLKGNFNYHEGLIPCLPNLKILYFDVHHISAEFLVKLFKSCPLLEELSILGGFKGVEPFLDLSALSLKKLYVALDYAPPQKAQFVINSSKLEEIKLVNLCLDFVRFVEHPSALITANIHFHYGLMDDCSKKLELAELLSGVSSLYLNPTTYMVLADLDDILVPNFNNLTYLDIGLYGFGGSWNDVLGFLRFCPNLEDLSLKDPEEALNWIAPEYAPPCGLTNVKNIKIKRFKGSKVDVEMIRYIMRYAKVLRLLSLDVSLPCKGKDTISRKEYKLCEKLFLLESSSACEIQFSGRYLNVSSKGGHVSSGPRCQSLRLGCHQSVG